MKKMSAYDSKEKLEAGIGGKLEAALLLWHWQTEMSFSLQAGGRGKWAEQEVWIGRSASVAEN